MSNFATIRKQMDVSSVDLALVGAVGLGIFALAVLYFSANYQISEGKSLQKKLRKNNASVIVVVGSGKSSHVRN